MNSLPRIIPVLLLKEEGLVKTTKFKKPRYLGDPINTVKIFNDKYCDEIVLLDIEATNSGKINFDLIKRVGNEAFMPFSYGGGIRTLQDAIQILQNGAEKVILNSVLHENMDLITQISEVCGAQSVVGAFDVKKDFFGKYRVYKNKGKSKTTFKPNEYAQLLEEKGVGEIFVTDIDRENTQMGYNKELFYSVSENVSVPLVVNGGIGNVEEANEIINESKINAFGVGGLFLFNGPHKAFLISYKSILEDKRKTDRGHVTLVR